MSAPPIDRPIVCVFDVDGTLIDGDATLIALSKLPLVKLLVGSFRLILNLPSILLRDRRVERIKQAILEVYFTKGRHASNAGVTAVLPNGYQECVVSHIKSEALEALQLHRDRGSRIILCSASPRIYLQCLADRLGVELICTETARANHQWRPEITSSNCKCGEKVRRLQAHIGTLGQYLIEAYGDSRGDKELLEVADIAHYRSFTSEPSPYPSLDIEKLLPVVASGFLAYGLITLWSYGTRLFQLLATIWPTLLISLGLVLIGFAIRFVRWRLLLHALHHHPPVLADARIWMSSYAFTATPGRSGEAVRSLLLKRECGIPAPPTLVALVIERLTDATAVLLLVLLNVSLFQQWQIPLVVPITFIVAAVAIPCFVGKVPGIRRALKVILARSLPKRLANAGKDGLSSLRCLLKPYLLLQATVIGALAWSMEGIAFGLVLRSMGVYNISWGGALIAHTTACLLGALTMLPGGLGTTEAGTVALLAMQGLPVGLATTATLLVRLMTLWFATGLGVTCLLLSLRTGRQKPR